MKQFKNKWGGKGLPQPHVVGALLRRNFLYRRRNLVGSVMEIALPVLMILAVLLLKSVTPGKNTTKKTKFYNTTIPNASEAFIPLTFGDYVTALQAKRKCYNETKGRYKGLLGITGMPNGQYDWQVPFVRCNDMQCRYVGQDAQSFCEYLILGIAPDEENDSASRHRAVRFRDWIWEQYPVLTSNRIFNSSTGGTVLRKVNNTILPFRFDFVKLFTSRNDMETYITSPDYGTLDKPKLAAGVLWAGGNSTQSYKYYLRQNATLFNVPAEQDHPAARTTPNTRRKFDAYAKDDEWCEMAYGAPFLGERQYSCTGQYLYNGVLTMQNLIGKFILQDSKAWQTFPVAEAGIAFVPFPSPAYKDGGFFSNLGELVGIMICLGLLMPVASMVGAICHEKELRQKELMRMMGVTEAEIGWSWFISYVLFYVCIVATIVSIVSFQLYENSNRMTLFGFWILTFTALITYCMALSTLVSNGTRGVVIAVMLTLMGTFLVMAYSFWKGEAGVIQLISVHPVAAFSYGLQEVGRLEDAGVGVTENTMEATDGPSGYNFWMCIRMLMIDTAAWGMLAWYLNRVVKPVYGTALPIYFPFTRSYWLGPRQNTDSYNDDVAPVQEGVVDIPVEDVSDSLRQQTRNGQSIELRGLTKQFGSQVAVDKLSLSMYKGQVTALLGHNGAGKTTTISMLTGTLLPTAGCTLVCGRDSRTQMREIRQNIGICLQHNCLFPQLTVREHVEFFARVKGVYANMSRVEADRHVNEAINDLALSTKSDTFSRRLSGGMKRKLSVAIAFCGGSEAVFLDEPTSGMDPFSRRFCWNVIRRYRKGRVIILTTHFMDEADILGDRIAIMSEGRLCCLGSPLFLKKTFGVGYQLTIELPKTHKGKKETNDKKVQKAVTKAVEQAVLLSHVDSEMTYRLPVGASSRFGRMFDKLDRAIEQKRAVSYGVGITTLEEVFLQVSRGKSKLAETEKGEMKTACIGDERIVLEDDSTRFVRHTQALFKKRVSNFRRDKRAWLCTTLLPSIFVFTGFLSIKLIPDERDFRPIPLRIEDYNIDATSPRNPIGVNSPSNPFTCQPGYCAYNESETLHDLKETNETYYFCGEQARVDWYSNQSCSISVPTFDVVSRITDAGAIPVLQNVSTVKEVSSQLWNLSRSNAFMASQYGALYFTRDNSSILNETGEFFDDELYYVCEEAYEDADYMTLIECESFLGLGYLISYNFTALHVSPTFQVLATQSLAREAMKTNDFHIDCVLDPLPITLQEKGFSDEDKAFNAWYLVVLGFPFVAGAYATFVVEEKESKSKHLQTVAGVSPAAYWVSTFLWDVANYALPMGITVMLMFAFDVTMLTTSKKDVLSGVIILLLLFGPAAASFTYCISQFFRSPSRCNVFVIIQGFFFGVGGPLAVLYLQIYGREIWKPQPKLIVAANVISWVMRFNPFFCLGKGLLYAIYIETIHLIEKGVFSVWSSDILKYEVIFLAWQSIGYLILAVILDKCLSNPSIVEIYKDVVQFLSFRWLVLPQEGTASVTFKSLEDDDVIAEQDRVARGKASHDLIVLNKLTKIYSNGKKAVDQLSLGIPPGQCFGLLGINGAGKTTTMQMLTAEFPASSGDAVLAGDSVVNSPEKTRRLIGYCPQFDAHFPNLTGREHVELYARIKGIPNSKIELAISRKLEQVGLSLVDSERLASDYSGGMKRRLSLACAMVGQPRILFLDEVSTGVDPVARREIWRLISELVNDKSLPAKERTSAILTTHSMEECEALCPRIGIMANGRLRCLGSAQHLKNKFGKGFQIEMKVQLVKNSDDDCVQILADMRQWNSSESASVGLLDARSFLHGLTGDDSLSSLLAEADPSGFAIFKDATSAAGVQVVDLVAFAAFEQRILKVKEYVKAKYPKSFFRERQDAKVRFEVESEGIKNIFADIEANRQLLKLSDYSVSQTSLEQVFNQHAKEAEGDDLSQSEGSQDKTTQTRGIKSWFSWKNDKTEQVDSDSSNNEDRPSSSDSPSGSSQSSPGSTDSRDRLRRLLSPQRSVPLLPLYHPSNERDPAPPCESSVKPQGTKFWSLDGTSKEYFNKSKSRDDLSVGIRSLETPLPDHAWLQSQSERVLNRPESPLVAQKISPGAATQESSRDHVVPLGSEEQQATDKNGESSNRRWAFDPRSMEFFSWLERQVDSYKKDTEELTVDLKQKPSEAPVTICCVPYNESSESFSPNTKIGSPTMGSPPLSKVHKLGERNTKQLQHESRPRKLDSDLIPSTANDSAGEIPSRRRTNKLKEVKKNVRNTEAPVSPRQTPPKALPTSHSPSARLHARVNAQSPRHSNADKTDPEEVPLRRSIFVDMELAKECTPNRDQKSQRDGSAGSKIA